LLAGGAAGRQTARMSTACAPYAAGLALGASLIVAVGAQNTFVLRQGLRREHVGAIVALCVGLDALLMTLGVSGLAASVGAHARVLDALALAGAACLLAYGVLAARRALGGEVMAVAAHGRGPSRRAALAQALACTLLNPHVYLDTVLLVGAVGAHQPAALRPAFLAGAVSASLAWFVALGYGARLLAPLFARPAAWRWLDGTVALTMGVLGVRLAASALH
jgi:L-lysine exporter family protein LysE/ArgO